MAPRHNFRLTPEPWNVTAHVSCRCRWVRHCQRHKVPLVAFTRLQDGIHHLDNHHWPAAEHGHQPLRTTFFRVQPVVPCIQPRCGRPQTAHSRLRGNLRDIPASRANDRIWVGISLQVTIKNPRLVHSIPIALLVARWLLFLQNKAIKHHIFLLTHTPDKDPQG